MKRFKQYLSKEIGIEFKACTYFFAILFFYGIVRIVGGSFQADLIIMAEMILMTYIMGYVQVYLLRNFEETDKFGWFEGIASTCCAGAYTVISYLCGWYERNLMVTLLFFAYMLLCFGVMIYMYYLKRHIDTELLNEELEVYKKAQEQEDKQAESLAEGRISRSTRQG